MMRNVSYKGCTFHCLAETSEKKGLLKKKEVAEVFLSRLGGEREVKEGSFFLRMIYHPHLRTLVSFGAYLVESDSVLSSLNERGTSSMKGSGGFPCICYFFAQEIVMLSPHRF